MQNKRTFIVVIILVILVLGWKLAVYNRKNTASVQVPITIENTASSSPTTTTPDNTKPTGKNAEIINEAWDVFQTYLTAAEKHDLETVTRLSYQLSDTCKDPKQTKGCDSLMDNASWFGGQMKKSDYTNVWYDNKQIILFTKENVVSTTTVKGIYRGFIYFTRDTNGTPKFLSLNPEVVAYVKTENKTPTEVDVEIQTMIKDSDEDGLADAIETCRENALSTCIKTDPNKRDSNNNGWWDGIEVLFYTKP
ncbi:MAG: hypothetical protein WAV25_00710 [Minisyncoccia bacterium]